MATALPLLGAAPASAAPDPWEATLERVVPAVVALRVTQTRSFDTQRAAVTRATGFVVDAERGLVLTNRHVVTPGPVTAEAVFLNHEKVALQPVYRDPVHDFGFFRYDPSDVHFMRPGEIELAPERARVGSEIRVVGNDAGEKLSILAGTLARIDRDAPVYGADRYNDFNTFYLQAASSTSGGSSGSPVVDLTGRALALNAGGARGSSSSFFLPLDRIVRALEALRAGEPVTRGTLQAVFVHRPYDELQRLGLRPESEARLRGERPDATGLLVVEEVLPAGPAEGRLEPGDIVLALDGRRLGGFVHLESVLDARVGGSVTFDLERGGEPLRVEVSVGDLHAITPDRYLEVSGGILHALSYQQARNRGLPVRGVYVASPGYALGRSGVPARAVLHEVGGVPVPDLAAAASILAALPDGARVPLRYVHLEEPRAPQVAVLTIDRRWFPMRSCVRDDAAGTWHCVEAPPAPPAEPPPPRSIAFVESGPRPARRLAPSLAFVEFDVPFKIDGAHGSAFSGVGLVVDAERGLVVVDRDTVPVSLGDATVTFGGAVTVPGHVVALHPEHNLAVVGYDPSTLGDTKVLSARLAPGPLEPGDALWLVGLTAGQRPVARETEVARVEEIPLPLPSPPRFRESNLDLVRVTESEATVGGALTDDDGRVRALWTSISRDDRGKPEAFFAGVPVETVLDFVEPLRAGRVPSLRSLGVELGSVPQNRARDQGLPEAEAALLIDHDPERRRVLAVQRILGGSPAAELLRVGDLLVSADGSPVTRPREVERSAQGPRVALRLVRDGRLVDVEVPTVALDPIGTRRALIWAGALLQPPPRAARMQRGIDGNGVYVAGRWWGSPVERHGLAATRRIVAVDGRPTPDLDAFLAAVGDTPDRGSVRLRAEDLDGKVEVLTLELDRVYWPTEELAFGPGGWARKPLAR